MPARDFFHDAVRNALEKDGWTITADPFVIEYEEVTLFADLGAAKALSESGGEHRVVIEIKGFSGPSLMRELEVALGQYEIYRGFLEVIAPDHDVYLAVADVAFDEFFSREAVRLIVSRFDVRLVVIDVEKEEIVEWTS